MDPLHSAHPTLYGLWLERLWPKRRLYSNGSVGGWRNFPIITALHTNHYNSDYYSDYSSFWRSGQGRSISNDHWHTSFLPVVLCGSGVRISAGGSVILV